jgi:hypothetical protein
MHAAKQEGARLYGSGQPGLFLLRVGSASQQPGWAQVRQARVGRQEACTDCSTPCQAKQRVSSISSAVATVFDRQAADSWQRKKASSEPHFDDAVFAIVLQLVVNLADRDAQEMLGTRSRLACGSPLHEGCSLRSRWLRGPYSRSDRSEGRKLSRFTRLFAHASCMQDGEPVHSACHRNPVHAKILTSSPAFYAAS